MTRFKTAPVTPKLQKGALVSYPYAFARMMITGMLSLKGASICGRILFFSIPGSSNLGRENPMTCFSAVRTAYLPENSGSVGPDPWFYASFCYLMISSPSLSFLSIVRQQNRGYFVVGEAIIAGTPIGEIHKSGI